MIEVKWQTGPVKLANGFGAVIHRFCEKRKRYIGELQDGSGSWFAREWDASGWYIHTCKTAEDPYNLAPPPKKTVRVQRWLVVYPSGSTQLFTLKYEAIAEAKQHGFALIEIDREAEEGEGL